MYLLVEGGRGWVEGEDREGEREWERERFYLVCYIFVFVKGVGSVKVYFRKLICKNLEILWVGC